LPVRADLGLMSEDGRRWATLGLAGLLGLCCVSVSALLGGTAFAGGTAGATAVTTGIATLRGLAVAALVTVVTLVPIYGAWRWRSG
jgi:hypothetical protein